METFVMLSITDWDAPQFGSRQQIARELALRGFRVLFIEVPRALHSLWTDPSGTRRALRRLGELRTIEERLLAYTPRPVLPFYYQAFVSRFNQGLLSREIRRALNRLAWPLDVLWTYWPNTESLLRRLAPRLSVYHCIDDIAAARYPFTTRNGILRMEEALCRRVDLVFTRTEAQAERCGRYAPRTHVMPGGVDLNRFVPSAAHGAPPALDAIPRPRAGLVGTLDDRIDVGLLAFCARARPALNFVLVGPLRRHLIDLRPLEGLSNVHLLPACAPVEVPAYLAALDVCLIPYRMNAYTQGVSPLKLYECLAMGKPLVAMDLPYLRRERGHITLATTHRAFLDGLDAELRHPQTPEVQARRRALAAEHSWAVQVDRMVEHMAPWLEQ